VAVVSWTIDERVEALAIEIESNAEGIGNTAAMCRLLGMDEAARQYEFARTAHLRDAARVRALLAALSA